MSIPYVINSDLIGIIFSHKTPLINLSHAFQADRRSYDVWNCL